jgi:hypothetical protein
VLGTDFITDVLLVSLSVEPPVSLAPGYLATDVALRTVSEALSKAACELLELEPTELQGEYRAALTPQGRDGLQAEIYLYDTLPGGAGFTQRAKELGTRLFERALNILEQCPDRCDRSCYRCLRSYKNKFEHELLDRDVGASLLRYVLGLSGPELSPERMARSTDVLVNDLRRQGLESNAKIEREVVIKVPGLPVTTAPILVTTAGDKKMVVALHGPLTPGDPSTAELRELKEYGAGLSVHLVDEILVRRNLPYASRDVIDLIAGAAS